MSDTQRNGPTGQSTTVVQQDGLAGSETLAVVEGILSDAMRGVAHAVELRDVPVTPEEDEAFRELEARR